MNNEIQKPADEKPAEAHETPVYKTPTFLKGLIIGVIAIIVLLGVFQLGMIVGSRKANFAYQRFGFYNASMPNNNPSDMPRMGMMDLPLPGNFDPHGAAGVVISNDGEKRMVVKGPDGSERIIIFSTTTDVQDGNQNIPPSEIPDNRRVVIFGNPDEQGQIQAKFIRVFDRR